MTRANNSFQMVVDDTFLAIEEKKYHEYSLFRSEVSLQLFEPSQLSRVDTESTPLLEGHLMLLNSQKLIVVSGTLLESSQDINVLSSYVHNILSRPFRKIEWKVVLKDETRPLQKILVNEGLKQYEVCTIMTLHLDEITTAEAEVDLDLRRVNDKVLLEDFASIHSQFSQSSADYARGHHTSSPIFKNHCFFYVGYKNDIPVSCIAIIRSENGTLGLHMVATHPDHRNKGYASSLIQRVLKAFRVEDASLQRVVLAASAESVDLYLRLGFKAIAQVASFGMQRL